MTKKKSISETYADGLWPALDERVRTLRAKHTAPDVVRLTAYETDADLRLFRPEEDVNAAQHKEAMELLAKRVTRTHGLPAQVRVISTADYLRWLASNQIKDSPASRATYITL